MKKHLNNQIKFITEASESIDEKKANELVDECLKTIKNGESIVATALGKNVPICEKFVGTLNSVGIKARFMHTNSAIHGDLGMIHDGDLVIILSKSGETEETAYLSSLLSKRKVKRWLITCNKEASLLHVLKKSIIIDLRHEGDRWNLIPNNSSLIFLSFLQALSMEIIEKLNIQLKKFKINHPGGNIGKILRENENY